MRDCLQDIQMSPKGFQTKFDQYAEFFWNTKVMMPFKVSNVVCLVFDSQKRGISPKDALQRGHKRGLDTRRPM